MMSPAHFSALRPASLPRRCGSVSAPERRMTGATKRPCRKRPAAPTMNHHTAAGPIFCASVPTPSVAEPPMMVLTSESAQRIAPVVPPVVRRGLLTKQKSHKE